MLRGASERAQEFVATTPPRRTQLRSSRTDGRTDGHTQAKQHNMPDQKDPMTGGYTRQEGPEPVDPATGKPKAKPPMSWADIRAIATLLVLYFLQGVPMGVCAAMPMLFQDANMSDADQGKFSFASWPFSLKVCTDCGRRSLRWWRGFAIAGG